MIGWKRAAPAIAVVAALFNVVTAGAAGDCRLFGDATTVKHGPEKGAAQLTTTGPNGYAGVDVSVAGGTTFAQLTHLSTDYQFTQGTCGLGSPRFQINVVPPGSPAGTTPKNIFVYVGVYPQFTCVPGAEANTGEYIGDPTLRYDSTQVGGPFYGNYQTTLAAYGNYVVTGIQFVIDGPGQTVIVDNLRVNDHVCFPDRHREAGEAGRGGGGDEGDDEDTGEGADGE